MDEPRIELLARRVRWLDRYRRKLAIGSAVLITPLIYLWMSNLLGIDWPRVHAVLMTIVVSAISWWTIEVALAWKTAVWETECDRLVRDKGLPRAELVKR